MKTSTLLLFALAIGMLLKVLCVRLTGRLGTVHLALLIVEVYLGIGLSWAVAESPMEADPSLTLSPPSAVQPQEQPPLQSYATRQERNLLGDTGDAILLPTTPPPQRRRDNPSKATLHLRLIGTVVGGPEYTRAVIEDPTVQKVALYELGDLVHGAKIMEIHRNRVLLDYYGHRQELRTSSPYTREVTQNMSVLASLQHTDQRPSAPAEREHPDEGEEMAEEIRQVSDNMWVISRKALTKQVEHLPQLLTEARLAPHFGEDRIVGFKIAHLAKQSFLERIGLRIGDILKAINHQQLTSLEKAFEAYPRLHDEPVLHLEVERDHQQEVFTYEIR
jgi:general secretion pathway protein C